jgi:diaminopimelate epimerase
MGRTFSKYETLGNDYIVVDSADGWTLDEVGPKPVRNLCARGTGVSAEGVIWIGKAEAGAPITVVAAAADGSKPPLNDSAARCVAAHLARTKRIATGRPASLDTGFGLARLVLIAEEGSTRWSSSIVIGQVNVAKKTMLIGLPAGSMHSVEQVDGGTVIDPPPPEVKESDEARWLDAVFVDMGRPEVVVNTAAMLDGDEELVIEALERRYPAGTGITFAKRLVEGSVRARSYEIGRGWTRGSGVSAAAAAGVERVCGWQEANPFDVELDGGTLKVHVDGYAEGWHARVTGTARWVFDGALPDAASAGPTSGRMPPSVNPASGRMPPSVNPASGRVPPSVKVV